MRLASASYIFFTSFLFSIACIGQNAIDYPKGYFRNPLSVPMNLSGNFGELRPNHYHMGLDLKTLKRENLPVYAAADGYVAKIKIEPAGFGRAIYINHPNGLTTVYCHLNDFTPALEKYLKDQQYKLETWRVLLDIPSGLFPVKKGEYIANSGNTGGSQAPHVHFEIRRTADDVNLNPMLFGFPLADNTRPSVIRLAMYDRTRSVYEQAPRMLPVIASAAAAKTAAPIISTSPRVSFAFSSSDTHSGSSNANGIFEGLIYDNGRLVTGFKMDNISYDDTRYLNAHIDYRTRATGGPYLQHLSELPGYASSIYTKHSGDGSLDISDGLPHEIRIEARDAYGNTTSVYTRVQYKAGSAPRPVAAGKMFFPRMLDGEEHPECEYYIGEKCLYDSVHIVYRQTVAANPAVLSAVHTIGASYIPLQDSMLVRIKPTSGFDLSNSGNIVMQRFSGNKTEVQKVQWQKGWAMAKFRDFGSFQLIVDNLPPVITPVGIAEGSNLSKASRIAFTVSDNLGSFSGFRAELDGKWLRFTNDKGRTFIYRFDEKCPPGQHQLKISVADAAGNIAIKTFNFTR